jgi:hypothetical protein
VLQNVCFYKLNVFYQCKMLYACHMLFMFCYVCVSASTFL